MLKSSMRFDAIVRLCGLYRGLYAEEVVDRLIDVEDQVGSGAAHYDDGSGSGAALAARAAREVGASNGSDRYWSSSDDGDEDSQENASGTGGAGAYADGATGVVVTFNSL